MHGHFDLLVVSQIAEKFISLSARSVSEWWCNKRFDKCGMELKRNSFSIKKKTECFIISDRCFRTGLKEQRKKKEEWMVLSDFYPTRVRSLGMLVTD